MEIKTIELTLKTNGRNDMINLTDRIKNELHNSKMREGNILIFVKSSTSAITTIEYEPGLIKDFPRVLDMIIPEGINYSHNDLNNDDNGSAHIRSTVVGTSLCVPFLNCELLLGTWQNVVLVDFDTTHRERKVILQFTGQ